MPEPQLMRCGSCGTTNRVPPEKLQAGYNPICGRCKKPLSSTPVHLTDANFAQEVERSTLPVLVDMWAPWCPPCNQLTPIIEQLAMELYGRVRVAKINIDENPVTTARFRVQSIPVLLIFKEGREVDRMIGAQSKSEILRHIDRLAP
jgi:thioredoxin 2